MICELYVPVWARVHVHIGWPGRAESALFECDCMSRRVQMIDRRPAYLLGLQYDEMTEDQRDALERFMIMVDEAAA